MDLEQLEREFVFGVDFGPENDTYAVPKYSNPNFINPGYDMDMLNKGKEVLMSQKHDKGVVKRFAKGGAESEPESGDNEGGEDGDSDRMQLDDENEDGLSTAGDGKSVVDEESDGENFEGIPDDENGDFIDVNSTKKNVDPFGFVMRQLDTEGEDSDSRSDTSWSSDVDDEDDEDSDSYSYAKQKEAAQRSQVEDWVPDSSEDDGTDNTDTKKDDEEVTGFVEESSSVTDDDQSSSSTDEGA